VVSACRISDSSPGNISTNFNNAFGAARCFLNISGLSWTSHAFRLVFLPQRDLKMVAPNSDMLESMVLITLG
jgi:hypothetical protein